MNAPLLQHRLPAMNSLGGNRNFLFFLIVVILAIRIIVAPSYFADYASYVDLLEELKFNSDAASFILEPLSKLPLFIFGEFLSIEHAVSLFSYINTLVFLIFFTVIVLRKNRSIIGLFLLFAIYVPLIAFISLRATPAYLCVALSFEFLWERRFRSSLMMCVVASLFHLSAVLVLVPLCICIVVGRFHTEKSNQLTCLNLRAVLVFFVSLGLYFSGPILFGAVLQNIIPADSILSRYSAYMLAVEREKLTHLVYFFCVLMVVYFFLRDTASQHGHLFVEIAVILFAVLAISPVVAYRYSLYFMIPVLLNFPILKSGAREFWIFVIALPACGLFLFGVWQSVQS
jgi:hypothetical protein